MNALFGLIALILSSSVIASPFWQTRVRERSESEYPDTEVINDRRSEAEDRRPVTRSKLYPPEYWFSFPDFSDLERQIQKTIDKSFAAIPRIHFKSNEFDAPAQIDPSNVKNETIEDIKIVDGKVIETKEQTYSVGDKTNGRVFRVKTVNVYPVEQNKTSSDSKTITARPNSNYPDRDVEIVSTEKFENPASMGKHVKKLV